MAQETPQNPGIPRRRPTPPPGARVSTGSTSASSSSAQKPAAPASAIGPAGIPRNSGIPFGSNSKPANGPAGIPRNSGIPFGSNSIPPNPKPANGPACIPRNSGIPIGPVLSSFLGLSLASGGPDPSAAAVPAPSFPAPDYTRMNLGACRCWDDYQVYDVNAEKHWILALWQARRQVIQRQEERLASEGLDWWYTREVYFDDEVEASVMDPRRGARPACKMQDPSQGIQRELLPHVHLVSAYRFPHLPSLPPGKVSEWLLGAPKIARGQSPFYWTYLDRPVDGTILLVWQSMALGSEFPSDGYVWSPTETAFQLEVEGGYTLEMYHQKVGYAPGEPVATHSRRRYRLMPSKFPNSSVEPDLSLWIVHYGQCDPNDRVPSNVIPIDIRVQNTMQTRAYLQQQGQIVQKEFMLHDRANWPQISFPRNQPRGGPMYHANQPPSRIPQSMAYPPQHGSVGPPAKRARTQQAPPNAATGSAGAVMDADDQEDTTIGDVFDFITPRDVSLLRYKHNHEWMEEVLSSPYSIHQIIPADLGLGLRGELASLTDGFFDAPFDPSKHPEIEKSYIGRLDHGKAEEFRKRTEERVEQLKKDVEKMEAKHKKRMAKFKKGSLLLEAEKELRTAVADPSDTGPEYWRLEGKIDIDDEEDGKVVSKVPSKVADILAEVEASLGRTAAAVREIRRIQDGGFEEPAPVPVAVPSPQKPQQPSLVGTPQGSAVGNDMDIGNSAAGLLDQYHGISSNATPLSNFGPSPQPHLQAHSNSGTPGIPSPSPQPVAHISPQPQIPAQDVNMSGTTEEASTDATGTGDWIVVPSGGVSPTAAEAPTTEPSTISVSAAAVAAKSPHPIATENSTPLPDFSASPNDFADLADLDTAGDALAGYGDDMVHDGDLGLDIAMDDSAFGEAFHGVELREDGDDTGDGI